jgi:MiaB-like tRNA modifying enzyme
MNYGEGTQLAERMSGMGYEESSSVDAADIVILNTCTVVDTTEKKMVRRMTELRSMGKEVIVTGCMAEVQPGRISIRLPDSLIISPQKYSEFSDKVSVKYGCWHPLDYKDTGSSAILPIAQGCLGTCSYCITRFARGKLISYPVDELLVEFKKRIKNGSKEILITAQDTACYGRDIDSSLPELLTKMLEVPGDYKIRVGMMNLDWLIPIVEKLMIVFKDPRMYRFLHLPVQSGSNKILEKMKRQYTVEEYLSLVEMIRARYPDMSISTDVIAGFPGETNEDHQKSVDLLRKLKADTVNITRFSPRPGTKAAKMEQVNGRIIKDRSTEFTTVKNEIELVNNEKMVGKIFRALITEEGTNGSVIARTDNYRPVGIPERIPVGSFCTVEITGCAPTYLVGRTLNN